MIPDPVRVLPVADCEALVSREWLVANGLGGYASGTVSGLITRRYHGMLVAALPAPYGRTVMLNDLRETVQLPNGSRWQLQGEDRCARLEDFRLELGLPVWRYRLEDALIEKRILMPHNQNTSHITYRLLEGPSMVRLRLAPHVQFRGYEAAVDQPPQGYKVTANGPRFAIHGPDEELPPLHLYLAGKRSRLRLDGGSRVEQLYPREAERGYPARGGLWRPGDFAADLDRGEQVVLIASTEDWHTCLALGADDALAVESNRRRRLIALAHPSLRRGAAAELVLAADSFVIRPAGRVADAARALSTGDDIRTVIAGYHWFTDWGRDTMISLEGLTMVTGRVAEAGWILRTFSHYVRDGLIPNMFPDGQEQGLYHTADASLWYFHAVARYLAHGGNRDTLGVLLPQLVSIAETHLDGTRFGIHVDSKDGLLTQGAPSYQLTWMDAKVEDWVVTPRRGKAVELNALWYNALCLLAGWLRESGEEARAASFESHAARTREAFNRRFWNERKGYLYDVIDGEHGDEDTLRPNQIFAVSLPHAVLDEAHWRPVVETVRDALLTPVGLRSLDRHHPEYRPRYYGDLRARDAAYHQGTIWAWLIGPFIDAWLRLHPDDLAGARDILYGLAPHLEEFGTGTIAEVFDGDPPYHARGCISQAWSVAEWLRCWCRTAPEGS